jgi:hypothetical protein
MLPEEGARFDIQVTEKRRKMLQIGKKAVALQELPIENPDALPKRQFVKKKLHGRADTRGLSEAEIAGRELQAREARKAAAT